jgi:hypothetical protein
MAPVRICSDASEIKLVSSIPPHRLLGFLLARNWREKA